MKLKNVKTGETLVFRMLDSSDQGSLGAFFDALSEETRKRYGPHPLNADFASHLCHLAHDTAQRFVLLTENEQEVLGYFILDYHLKDDDAQRYRKQGIELMDELDPLFAPCIADQQQGQGLASLVMPLIIDAARAHGARSIVLMGGTQATNPRAVHFYSKFRFQECGGYTTDVYNHDMRLVF